MGNSTENLNLGKSLPAPLTKPAHTARHQRRIAEVNQSVNIQLPSAEDWGGFLWNIRIKNVSVVEQF